MSNQESGKPTIVKGASDNPYLITQAVRDLGSDRRINEIILIKRDAIIFSDQKPASGNLRITQSETDPNQPPFTRPYSTFDSWNPEE